MTEGKWTGPVKHEKTEIEQERYNRILLSVAAYSYEFLGESIMTDDEFDALSRKINLKIDTSTDQECPKQRRRSRKLDRFFKKKFHADTGMWIHTHPELREVHNTYYRWFKKEG